MTFDYPFGYNTIMSIITIPKKEYSELLDAKLRYEYMRNVLDKDFFSAPTIRNRNEIIKMFKATKNYSAPFLKSLEKGLKRSSYFLP